MEFRTVFGMRAHVRPLLCSLILFVRYEGKDCDCHIIIVVATGASNVSLDLCAFQSSLCISCLKQLPGTSMAPAATCTRPTEDYGVEW